MLSRNKWPFAFFFKLIHFRSLSVVIIWGGGQPFFHTRDVEQSMATYQDGATRLKFSACLEYIIESNTFITENWHKLPALNHLHISTEFFHGKIIINFHRIYFYHYIRWKRQSEGEWRNGQSLLNELDSSCTCKRFKLNVLLIVAKWWCNCNSDRLLTCAPVMNQIQS